MNQLLRNTIQTEIKIAGLPLLMDEPNEFLYEWKQKLIDFISLEKKTLASLQQKVSNSNQPHAKNLAKYIQDKNSHLASLQKLMEEILDFKNEDFRPEGLSYSPTQSFYSYNDLIFRDWCWESKDLLEYTNYCLEHISDSQNDVLVLGAGACGLPYKVACEQTSNNIYAIELNPYLIASAAKILNGKSLKLYDFPFSPKSSKELSKKWEIKPIKNSPSNLHLAIADFYNLPFKEKSFDQIIACWFFDILDDSLEDLLFHTKTYLKDGGELLFIGPSNFHKNDLFDFRAHDQIIESFKSCGFEVSFEIKNCKYLESADHSRSRNEDILFIKAKMIDSKSELIEDKRFSLDIDQEIPAIPEIQYRYEQSRVFSLILKHVDGNKSIKDIAKLIMHDLNLSEQEAVHYTNAFFNKLIWEIKSK